MELVVDRRMRVGLMLAFAGLALQIVALSWDMVMHRADPTLAATEGIFSFVNPSHALFVFGLATNLVGMQLVLMHLAGHAARIRADWGACSAILLLLTGAVAGIGLVAGALPGGPGHHAGGLGHHGGGPGHHGSALQPSELPIPLADDPTFISLQHVLHESGTEQALARLEELAAADATVLSNSHQLAHSLGLYSYFYYGGAPEAFSRCRPSLESGCYHGVLEGRLLSSPAITQREIVDLCARIVSSDQTQAIKFQCLHGLGHGLTAHFGGDIRTALRYCDFLQTTWDRSSCYGGVFMENVIYEHDQRFGNHSKPMHQLDHAHNQRQVFLRADDPHYPCNVVGARYQYQCYVMQGSVILLWNDYNFDGAFRDCAAAPARYATTCYESIGREVAGFTLRDLDESIALCELGEAGLRGYCFSGVARNLINVRGMAEDAFAFCLKAPIDVKSLCYYATGEQIAELYPDAAGPAQECAKVEPSYDEDCRRGARLAT